jgi:hypothetical protein
MMKRGSNIGGTVGMGGSVSTGGSNMGDHEETDTLYHIPCGGKFYELPLANTEGGEFVYDVAPQSGGSMTFSELPSGSQPNMCRDRSGSIYDGFSATQGADDMVV